jgi:cell division transport system permease protein
MLRRLDLPLMQTAPGRVLPWLTGGLVYVTMVLLGIAVMADQALLALDARARLITVILPLADDDGGSRDVDAALDVLLQKRFVIAAAPVGGDELRTLMTPWLGEPGGDLPLPVMIDVRLDPLATPDLAALQDELSATVAGATLSIDATVSERGEAVAALVRGWSGFLVLIAFLAGLAALAAITGLAVRLCRDAVDLLRCMGASPAYLAGQFERYALVGGLRIGTSGFGLALLTLIALRQSTSEIAIAGAIEIGLRPLDWALLAGTAAASLLLAVAVVRVSALWQLQRRPG